MLCGYQPFFLLAGSSLSATKQVFGKQGFPYYSDQPENGKGLILYHNNQNISVKGIPGAVGYGMGQLRVKGLTGQTDGLSSNCRTQRGRICTLKSCPLTATHMQWYAQSPHTGTDTHKKVSACHADIHTQLKKEALSQHIEVIKFRAH